MSQQDAVADAWGKTWGHRNSPSTRRFNLWTGERMYLELGKTYRIRREGRSRARYWTIVKFCPNGVNTVVARARGSLKSDVLYLHECDLIEEVASR